MLDATAKDLALLPVSFSWVTCAPGPLLDNSLVKNSIDGSF